MAWIDEDRDGRHDLTGMTQEQYEDARRRRQAELDATGSYTDADHDGRNDANGETYEEFRTRREAGETYQTVRDRYDSSGEAERDLDSGRGRDPRYYGPGRDGRDGGDGSGAGGSGSGEVPAWVSDTAGIPLVGGPADAWLARQESERQQRGWDDLDRYLPSPDELAVDYQEERDVGGPAESLAAGGDAMSEGAEQRALDALAGVYEADGITESDRARMQLGEMEVGRQARAHRDADMAALQARGMGGSGAQIASMLSAGQGAQDGLWARDAEIQAGAQDRALDAMAQAGTLASQMRGEQFRENTAADDLNRWNADYQRGREERNTRWRNRTAESRSEARQQSYENRERQQAGRTDQWQAGAAGARADAARNDENARGVLSSLGELLDL